MLAFRRGPRLRTLVSGLLLPALIVTFTGSAAPICRAAEPDVTTSLIPSSEVKSGMRGYGLTAFKGVRPERFGVEVLGKLEGWWPKDDLILVRMSGPVVEEAGIISGMSGSPVYLDGRLAGAVAYGWRYTKIPLAGVTPIEQMLRVDEVGRRAPDESAESSRVDAGRLARARWRRMADAMTERPGTWETARGTRRAMQSLAAPRFWRSGSASCDPDALPASVRAMLPVSTDQALQPLPLPVALGGLGAGDPGLRSLVREAGLLPVQAAASGAEVPEDVVIEPGIPVGAAFVTGDLDIAGMGTLTWVEGDRALAFGHSMFQSGRTDVPMVVGYVQAIVPSLSNSFKLSSSGQVIGRVLQDREPAIFARLGQEAPMFPCTVHVRGTMEEDYDYRVAGYWETAADFAYYALYYSSTRWEGSGNRFTLEAKSRIKLKGREKPIELANTYTSYSVLDPSVDLVVMPMERLMTNPYGEVEIESVDYDLTVTPGFQAALIESVRADRAEVAPGDELTLYVRLLHYRGERTSREIKVRIPEAAKPGTPVQVIVCDAMTNRMIERSMDRGFSSPLNLDELVRLIEDVTPSSHLTVRASVADRGLRYEGAAMPALPPSALSILELNEGGSQTAQLLRVVEQSIETPWVVEGAQMVTLRVVEPDPHNP